MAKRRVKVNAVLLLIFLLLIITLIVFLLNYNNKDEDKSQAQDIGTVTQQNEGKKSYYDYYKDGKLEVNTAENVKLPDNYLDNYKITSNDENEIRNKIYLVISESDVTIPSDLLEGYYTEIYNNMKEGADLAEKTVDQYIKEIYKYNSFEEYKEANKKYFEDDIKKDMVYEALAKEYNVTVNRDDIEEFYSERLSNGDTYESLVALFGEKLMYKYTLQNKVEKTLTEKLSQ